MTPWSHASRAVSILICRFSPPNEITLCILFCNLIFFPPVNDQHFPASINSHLIEYAHLIQISLFGPKMSIFAVLFKPVSSSEMSLLL